MASMNFGYKSYDKATDRHINRDVSRAACWAALKWSTKSRTLTEVTWAPEHGESRHVKVLLPLLFPDIKYREEKVGTRYQVVFPGLENVYRNNFMFRMFVIRNIDRDLNCRMAFEYFLKAGYDPLMSAAVAANIDIRHGWKGEVTLGQKGYACCFSTYTTVADVRAFARKPQKHHGKDEKFGTGAGYGYYGEKNSGLSDPNAVQAAIFHYKPSSPQFASKRWGDGVQGFLANLFKDKKLTSPEVAKEIGQIKVTH